MIEPTEEYVEAYRAALRKRAQELIDDVQLVGAHDMTAYGLAAVLALVERDYDVLPKPQGVRAIANPCLCGADLGPPWDSIPHQRGSRGCRSAP